jgi:hypothetical protein
MGKPGRSAPAKGEGQFFAVNFHGTDPSKAERMAQAGPGEIAWAVARRGQKLTAPRCPMYPFYFDEFLALRSEVHQVGQEAFQGVPGHGNGHGGPLTEVSVIGQPGQG